MYDVHIVVDEVNGVNIMCQTPHVTRAGYHHGSLHDALVAAAFEAARAAGPDAIQIRPLAKELGVSPSAAYRHVPDRDHLLAEVSRLARQELARRQLVARDATTTPRRAAQRSRARFRAVGRAYIDFAVDEPHLFDTAFAPCPVQPPAPDDPSAWQVLLDAVNELLEAETMAPERVTDAPFIAWAAVHGIASILVRGAMADVDTDGRAIDAVLDGVMRSLEH